MPNPKAGTVTFDVERACARPRRARSSSASTRAATCTPPSARCRSRLEALETNFTAFMDQIVRAKPSAAKGVYVRNVAVSSTMGPGVSVDTTPTGNRDEASREGAARRRADRQAQGRLGALYYTDFTGLNVKRMTELRRRFRKAGVEYVVIKNTLALRAVNESGLTRRAPAAGRPASCRVRPGHAAKVLTDFAKENDQKPRSRAGCSTAAPSMPAR
jgi:hypothetical protein